MLYAAPRACNASLRSETEWLISWLCFSPFDSYKLNHLGFDSKRTPGAPANTRYISTGVLICTCLSICQQRLVNRIGTNCASRTTRAFLVFHILPFFVLGRGITLFFLRRIIQPCGLCQQAVTSSLWISPLTTDYFLHPSPLLGQRTITLGSKRETRTWSSSHRAWL